MKYTKTLCALLACMLLLAGCNGPHHAVNVGLGFVDKKTDIEYVSCNVLAVKPITVEDVYCEADDTPILMHTGDHRFDFSNPNRMLPVLEKYPDLVVVGAHFGGWSVWDEATRMLSKHDNFYVDCSSSLYAMTTEKAKEIIMAYGTDRVLFGTDYPMWEITTEIERFMKIDLTEEEREDILYNNALKLFINKNATQE